MKYQARVNAKISDKDKEKLDAIREENKGITVRYIIEDFIKDYCSTEPKGIKLEIKEIENEIKEIENKIDNLYENKHKLKIKLKTRKDKLNKTLDSYMDKDLSKAVEGISNICNDQKFNSFKDIPEITFLQIAKHNKVDIETLKKEVLDKLF